MIYILLTIWAMYATIRWWNAYRAQQRLAWRWALGVPFSGEPSGYIYFFIDPDNPKYVKIGRAKDWRRRMKQHQTANVQRLKLLSVVGVTDDVAAEKQVHDLFDREHIQNDGGTEWFTRTRNLSAFAHLISDRIKLEEW